MSTEPINKAINWTDGMMLNKDHFIQHENWVSEGIRNNNGIVLNDFNYGLLRASSGPSLEILVNIDQNSQLNINLTDCKAITKGGRYIDISSTNIIKLKYPVEKLMLEFNTSETPNELFDIILAVFPDKRIPVGSPNENEIPFRHPWILPDYQLHVVPSKQVNSSQMWTNHITVGRFQVVAKEIQFYNYYIPPCGRVDAYPALLDYYLQFGNKLDKISNAIAEYLRKHYANPSNEEKNICYILDKLVYFITCNSGYYKLMLKSQSPVFMVDFFTTFARLFKSAMGWVSEYEREDVLGYFSPYVSSRDIDNAAFELIDQQYDHQDIYTSVIKVERYLDLIQELLEKMVYSEKKIPIEKAPPEPKKVRKGPVIIRDGQRIT